jgi:hypothetical protein
MNIRIRPIDTIFFSQEFGPPGMASQPTAPSSIVSPLSNGGMGEIEIQMLLQSNDDVVGDAYGSNM